MRISTTGALARGAATVVTTNESNVIVVPYDFETCLPETSIVVVCTPNGNVGEV
jgi:hypothetical protein